MYYQWIMCAAIFMVGLLIQLFLFAMPPACDWPLPANSSISNCNASAPAHLHPYISGRADAYSVRFVPMAALGGALWATGNTLSVPVINYIGLSLGLLIWGSANMLMGWATGVFGLFVGAEFKDELQHPALNYAGVACAVVALACYTQVKSETGSDDPAATKPATMTAGGPGSLPPEVVVNAAGRPLEAPDVELLHAANTEAYGSEAGGGGGGSGGGANSKVVGCGMAVLAGVLFGNTFTPPNYLMYHNLGPADPMDYIFSHFCGIFATSTFWFVVYCCYMRGSPRINPRLTLPGMLSGAMWAVAQSCWFIANSALSVSVAFPIITSGPGIVSACWGVFVFGEIRGRRNFQALGFAIALSLTGCVMIGLSK
jgi:glucose uptake protein GlcU